MIIHLNQLHFFTRYSYVQFPVLPDEYPENKTTGVLMGIGLNYILMN